MDPAISPVLLATASAVLDHALAQRPLLGGGRLVCLDGPAGSGKTTLAVAVVEAAQTRVDTVHLIHADDLLTGWDGLRGIGPRLRNYVVGPLASGHPARYRRFDWEAGAPAEEHVVAPMDLLVLEGCGTGHRVIRSRRAALVWVQAAEEVRLARGLERDGEALRAQWLAWMAEEPTVIGTGRDADLRVDGDGTLSVPTRP